MRIENLTPGGYASNCFLVLEQDDAVLIDCSAPAQAILAALQKNHATLRAILLTHGHFDHMLTLEEVKKSTGAPIYLARADSELPPDGMKNAYTVFFGKAKSYPVPDRLFGDGDTLRFGALSFTVRLTPGHTQGSAMFLLGDVLFTGDTLFENGYGRYDLYGGDPKALSGSLSALAALSPTLIIYPGHGESTTLGAALAAL